MILTLVARLNCNPNASLTREKVSYTMRLVQAVPGSDMPVRGAHPYVINRYLELIGGRVRIRAGQHAGVQIDTLTRQAAILNHQEVAQVLGGRHRLELIV